MIYFVGYFYFFRFWFVQARCKIHNMMVGFRFVQVAAIYITYKSLHHHFTRTTSNSKLQVPFRSGSSKWQLACVSAQSKREGVRKNGVCLPSEIYKKFFWTFFSLHLLQVLQIGMLAQNHKRNEQSFALHDLFFFIKKGWNQRPFETFSKTFSQDMEFRDRNKLP